jgi:hypothetical protein
MRISVRWATVLCLWAAIVSPVFTIAAPTGSLVDPTARIDYGHTDGSGTLLLKIDGLDDQTNKPDLLGEVKDLQVPAPPPTKVDVSKKEVQTPGRGSRTFLLTLDVHGLPSNTTQKRWLSFALAGVDVTLQYTLTNMAADSFSWAVKGLPSIAIKPGRAIPISIATGPVPATGVRVLQTALIEKTSKEPIASTGLKLCEDAHSGCDGSGLSLPARSPVQLWLQGADNGPGQYEGSVIVASNEKPDGDLIQMTIYLSTLRRKLAGVGVIFLGVVLAWFCTVYIKNRIKTS